VDGGRGPGYTVSPSELPRTGTIGRGEAKRSMESPCLPGSTRGRKGGMSTRPSDLGGNNARGARRSRDQENLLHVGGDGGGVGGVGLWGGGQKTLGGLHRVLMLKKHSPQGLTTARSGWPWLLSKNATISDNRVVQRRRLKESSLLIKLRSVRRRPNSV